LAIPQYKSSTMLSHTEAVTQALAFEQPQQLGDTPI